MYSAWSQHKSPWLPSLDFTTFQGIGLEFLYILPCSSCIFHVQLPEIAFQAYKQPKMLETNLLLVDAFKKSKLTIPQQIVGHQISLCFFLDDASS